MTRLKINIGISSPIGKIDEFKVRSWIGPEVDDGLFEEPKQWSNGTVRFEVNHDLVEKFGAEKVCHAIGSALYRLTKEEGAA